MKLSVILFACAFSAVAAQTLAAKHPLVVGAEQAQTRIVMLDPDVVSPEPAKIVWEWKPAKDAKLKAAGLAGRFALVLDAARFLFYGSADGVPFGGCVRNMPQDS